MEQIKAGDLVMVVGSCCGKSDTMGVIREVRQVRFDTVECVHCLRPHPSEVAHLSDDDMHGWVPLPWLKRIDPLSDPEEAQTKVEREIKKRSPVKA